MKRNNRNASTGKMVMVILTVLTVLVALAYIGATIYTAIDTDGSFFDNLGKGSTWKDALTPWK